MNDKGEYYTKIVPHVDEMDEALIANYNSVVGSDDLVYHLGDFAFKNADKYLKRLNGRKILIWGNHDSNQARSLKLWEQSVPYLEISIDKQFIVLCHYRFATFNRSYRGAIQFFGHTHNTDPGNNQQIDVGVDAWNYYPVSFEQALEKMKTLPSFFKDNKVDLQAKFDKLKVQWKNETAYMSSIMSISNFTYQRIIGMGQPVVPLILEELRKEGDEPSLWFMALKAITCEDPVKEDQGYVVEMSKAWLAWGKAKGLIN